MRQLVLVLGAQGQLGEAMAMSLASRHEVVACSREELELTKPAAVHDAITSVCPDVIVNCAAYTNVDGAEHEPVWALAVNGWGVRSIARAAAEIDATLVHYSTDFVFDGRTDRPYDEEDPPNPRGAYAVSKLLGEWFAAEVPRHYVLRLESLFGGTTRRSSVDKLIDGILSGQDVRAFVDRTVSPSYIDDVTAATLSLLDGDAPPGVYHCVNSGWTTWLALAHEVARLTGGETARVTPVPTAGAGLVAERPQFAALSNAKLARAGFEMPTWQDALQRHVTARMSQPST